MTRDRKFRPLSPSGRMSLGAPSIALLMATVLQGCCTSSVCGCESSTVDQEQSGSVPVDKLSDWVDESGDLIADCVTVCSALLGYDPDEATCTLDNVREPDAAERIAPPAEGQGGMGGGSATDPEAVLEVTCSFEETYYCEGRRHACWTSGPRGTGENVIGAWLARAASAEAASVASFRLLAADLLRLGAPRHLIDRTRSAASDEVVHANLMTHLAAAHGGVFREVAIQPAEQRTLFELALENAQEGCTKETFAALVALHQAFHATDRNIASCMKRIATDEIKHGQLAWDLHQWFLSQLSQSEAKQVEHALTRSLQELSTIPFRQQMDETQAKRLGLPDRRMLPTLASRLAHTLISAA